MLPTLALLVAFGSLQGAAPITVQGVIVDESGAVIAGATVTAPRANGTDCRTLSDDKGHFELACAQPGDQIRAEARGFRPVDVRSTPDLLRVVLAPSSYSESVVVTASRVEGPHTSPAAPISILTAADLALLPPAPLDDALKTTPGFSLFRRTTSRAANPTTQGAGLRGLSASGASRALVLADGTPLNDPFGGWVYWNRIPAAAIDRVEVVRGGASDLYGADALVGVVQVLTRRPEWPEVRIDVDGASRSTGRLSLFAGAARGGWRGTVAGEKFSTDGYVLVPEPDRGSIDTPANSRYTSGRVEAGYTASPAFSAELVGDVFAEHRDNGTPVQTNSTDIRQLSAAVGGNVKGSIWRISGQAGDQSYDQAFSSIAADRDSETLTSRQYVPASQHSVAAMWQRPWTHLDLLAGIDTRGVEATNNERSFAPDGSIRAFTSTAAFQRTSGIYVQATGRPAPSLTVIAGARGDVRQRTRDEGWLDGDSAFSPRVSTAWSVTSMVTVRGSLGWSYRAPTLNERYRGFRAGNVLTLPNADLRPESLRTVEGSVLVTPARGAVRVTLYRNDLSDAVTNVTVTSTSQLITRRRENVSSIDAWGAELEGEWRVRTGLTLIGASAFTRSRFAEYAPLDGLTVPQVPGWQFSLGLRGAVPGGLVVATNVRAFDDQFEDDRNTLVLESGSVVDVSVLRPFGRKATGYLSLENLFDVDYDVGRTPVRTVGQPFTLHVGVRVIVGR
jgi:iron complex outermembrane recepter protein